MDKQYLLMNGTIIFDENSDKIYIDIKEIAKYLGYSAHNGEYKIYSEDTNKCWVECKNETASFFLNSNKISKIAPNSNGDYEDYVITEPVLNKDGKLYSSIEGIQIGFNVKFNYNKRSNTITVYTLPYLVSSYGKSMQNQGFAGESESFKNQKAILYNLFVVKKSNNLYGVIKGNGEEVISSKYKSIEFNESGKEFYVKNNSNKVGIVNNNGDTKINLVYDDIIMIDKQSGLYVVKSSNKYGVLDNLGNIIIHLEYEKIGVDTSRFPSNNIANKYLLYESVIPVCQNNKWGLFNIKGENIVPVEFDAIGCTKGASGNSNVNNLLIVPSYKLIIFGKKSDNTDRIKYGIYNNLGEKLIPFRLDTAYYITSGGIDIYRMEYEGKTMDIEQYMKAYFPNKSVNTLED